MLYQTHPIAFHFLPSASSFLLRPTQREAEMECVESAALKTSFWNEMVAGLSSQQAFTEEVWVGNGVGEDFFVEDLLDFSNEEEEEDEEEKGRLACVSSLGEIHLESAGEKADSCSTVSVQEEFVNIPGSELGVPSDDVAHLEWLSHFVDDSFSEFPTSSHSLPSQPITQKPDADSHSETQKRPRGFALETQIPAKARSKRPRPCPRIRPFTVPVLPETPTVFSASSTSSTVSMSPSSSSQSSNCLILEQPHDLCKKPDSRKPNKGKEKENGHGQSQTAPRRCSHCLVQKTPQWRTGPLGSKTLCNACGVRYKSGRLLPEYRPAGSPTFLTEVHSNSHRKVLEMRRKKELPTCEPGSILVQTF
ncbi:GATA transcription factor 4-like [Aristolochia californica]|uniref:GATA transcription factor 4-like n=1 Tax=Aristolochia californica TaxID=171875 RepID=UPI0035DCD5B8